MRCGDILVKQQVEYKSPGQKGNDAFWDFSQQKTINERYELSYIESKDSIIGGQEHQTLYKYLLRGDSLFSYGYENITTTLTYQKPELLLVFPFNYGQTIEDYFYGIGEYCDRFSIQIQGKTLTETYRVGGGD